MHIGALGRAEPWAEISADFPAMLPGAHPATWGSKTAQSTVIRLGVALATSGVAKILSPCPPTPHPQENTLQERGKRACRPPCEA